MWDNLGMDKNQFSELVAALDSVSKAIQAQSGLIDLLVADNTKQWDAIALLRDDLHAVASVRAPSSPAILRSVDDE